MKKLLFSVVTISLVLAVAFPCLAKPLAVVSPDGKNRLEINQADGALTYAVFRNDKAVITPTPISITIDGVEYPGKAPIGEVEAVTGKPTIIKPAVPTIAAEIDARHNELFVTFKGTDVAMRAWAFDNGVAYRWESNLAKEVKVDTEKLAFNFAKDFQMYFPRPGGKEFVSHQECSFEKKPISKTKGKSFASPPVLVELGDGQYLVFTDVNVEGYPGFWFDGTDTTTVTAKFPPYPLEEKLERARELHVTKAADYIAKSNGKRSYPWRAFVLGDLSEIGTSTLVYNLSVPSRIEDPSWIKPGKVSWEWWNACNLYDVPFKPGIDQQTYMHYIDFASENNLLYIILDAGWSVLGTENLLKVIDRIDMPALVKYGEKKNVGLILWTSAVTLEASFDEAFNKFSEWGIKGIKVDYTIRDDQRMVDFCYKVAERAAEHKLIVDFHGGGKPAGIFRTWPNVLTIESVQGLEQNKWNTSSNPDLTVLLPFTRQVVGPMDYTPGAMINLTKDEFEARRKKADRNLTYRFPASQGTRCQQLAMYVVFNSPLQMVSDTPSNYRKNPKSTNFISRVPVTWDESRMLAGELGEYVVFARRHGKKWYLGALTNWKGRDVKVKLDFLSAGNYKLESWTDAEAKFCQKNVIPFTGDVVPTTSKVTNESEVTISLANGGGYAAIISAE